MKGFVASALFVIGLLGACPASATWRELTSDHLRIYSDDRDERDIRRVGDDAERFDAATRMLLGLPPRGAVTNKLTVFVVPSVVALAAIHGSASNDVVAFFHAGASGDTAFVPGSHGIDPANTFYFQPAAVLQKMYENLLFARTMPASVPQWLREGLIQALATATVTNDGSVVMGQADSLRSYEQETRDLPMEQLLTLGTRPKDDAGRARIVAKSWLVAHALLFDPARAGQLASLLKAIGNGETPLSAARQVFGDLAALDQALHAYAVQRRLPGATFAADKLFVTRFQVRPLSPGESATILVHMRSARIVNAHIAAAVYPDARTAAAPFPNDPMAQTWLAEAATDAGDYAAAEAAEDRALKVEPRFADALYQKAMTLSLRARKDADRSPTTWARVRELAAAASAAEPDRPAAPTLFYLSYLWQGSPPTADAIAALERASLLAPEAGELAPMLAGAYLAAGRQDEARRQLAMLASDPASGPVAILATRAIAAIDAGQVTGLADAMNDAASQAVASRN